MYYKYEVSSGILDAIDNLGEFYFQIVLRENMPFILGDCYFVVKKYHNQDCHISDSLQISYYSERDNQNEAMRKIKVALEFFVYLTGIPYNIEGGMTKSIVDSRPIIDINKSKRKLLKIQETETAYQRIRKKRKLLESTLQLYNLGIRLNILFGDENCEDAFFTFFKIIEKIVADTFEIEKAGIDRGKEETKECLERILSRTYNIQITEEKLTGFSGEISNYIFNIVFGDNYYRIMWFCQKYNISVDCNIISKFVVIRNKIAHAEKVTISGDEYAYIMKLTREVINAKFFSKKPLIIDSKIINIYE